MNQNEPIQQSPPETQPQNPPREEPREWIEPTFEKMTLKEAMTSLFGSVISYDGVYTSS